MMKNNKAMLIYQGLLVAMALPGLAFSPCAQAVNTLSFAGTSDYYVNSAPSTPAIGDLNGDGKADWVVAIPNAVNVRFSDGKGGYKPPISYPTKSNASDAVAIGDLNGDGKLDLAVANGDYNGSVSVLLNNGIGTFKAAVIYTTGSATRPQAVAISDVNVDGKPDIVTANNNTNNVSVLINKGAGTFPTAAQYVVDTAPSAIAVSDISGDGKPDIATANSQANTVSVLINSGAGTYKPKVSYAVGSTPQSVAIADVTGDGKADLAVANSSDNNIGVLVNKGTGTLKPAVNYTTECASSVAAADLNADGSVDLAVACQDRGSVDVLLNSGAGLFKSFVSFAAGDRYPAGIVIGDLDADGKANDLAVSSTSNDNLVSVLLNTTTNQAFTFLSPIAYSTGSGPAGSTAKGDFNADGKPDLAIANSNDGTISVLFGNNIGGYLPPVTHAVGNSPSSITAGDFNADGKLDLAVSLSQDNIVGVLLNQGGGAFNPIAKYAVGTGSTPVYLATGDFNADGKPDLAVALSTTGNVGVLLNKGTGVFNPVAKYTAGAGPNALAVGDVDGDGKVDLAVANATDGTVSVLINKGTGTFNPSVDYYAGTDNPVHVALGDLNGDGKPELVVTGGSAWDGVNVFLNNGKGLYYDPIAYWIGYYPAFSAIGDANNDGKPDIVTAYGRYYGTDKAVSVLQGSGNGIFSSPMYYAAGTSPYSYLVGVSLGDLNADGKADLSVVDSYTGSVNVLLAH